ncbi:MAG TPA: hypothetical protein VHC46_03040 [Thermodesulfobacteriota bacterium]|nr:hypothetical protein [Thermodesulfobacteriota bacterium]
MKSLSSVFWILLLALIFYVGFKIVPIYYRGIFGLRGVCQENADVYHKYGRAYVQNGISEMLQNIGIPKGKSQYSIEEEGDKIVIDITYRDSATFFDRYTRDFEFDYKCEGVSKAVY